MLAGAAASQGVSGKLDAALEAATTAMKASDFATAELRLKEAVQLGEQIQPHEGGW